MQKHFPLFIFLPIAVFLFARTWAQDLPEIIIEGASATTTIALVMPPNDLLDADEANFRLPTDEAVLCHSDEDATIDLQLPPDDFLDTSEAVFRLPTDEAVLCHSQEEITIDLVAPPAEFFDPAPDAKILSKTPVLFVPGLLSTEIKRDNELLWVDIEKMINPFNDDEFMDPLAFGDHLKPLFDTSLLGVIDKKVKIVGNNEIVLYEYSQGLIDEFEGQGYVAEEGADDQTFYTFPYDWRYGASGIYPKPDNYTGRDIANSDLLAKRIARLAEISPTGKVDVIAHSLGGLIAKKYVADYGQPKIGKLVFAGVPNLGAPLAGRALISGTDFGVFGLNPAELKKIAQNMPAAYDLLPSEQYFSKKGSWIRKVKPAAIWGINQTEELDYLQTRLYLAGAGTNNTATNRAIGLHSDLDDMTADDFLAKGIDSYNIAGCKSAVFSTLSDWVNADGVHIRYDFFAIANGDDTVPFESANLALASDANTFYAPETKHGQMPSFDGARQKIASIITGGNIAVPNNKIITRAQLLANDKLCKLYGTTIKIESPLAIKITDNFGNVIEDVGNVGPKNEIPGAAFDVDGEKKYVYLPQGNGQEYQIDLQGTGQGTFTLTAQAIENDIPQEPRVFFAIPVDKNLRGILEIGEQETVLEIDGGGDGEYEQKFAQDDVFTIDELISDFDRFAARGLIKTPQKIILAAQFAILRNQFEALEKTQARKLPANAKMAMIKAREKIINKHIDLVIKEIQRMAGRNNIDEAIAVLLINGLERIKL